MAQKVQNDDPLLSIPEAAEYLSQTPRWIRRRLEERDLPYVKLARRVMFKRSTLDRFIDQNTVETAPLRDG